MFIDIDIYTVQRVCNSCLGGRGKEYASYTLNIIIIILGIFLK